MYEFITDEETVAYRQAYNYGKFVGQLVASYVIELEKKDQQLDQLILESGIDQTTGLLNKETFCSKVSKITSFANRQQDSNKRHILLLCDIDNFKAVNTQLGYLEADERCLKPTAQLIKQDLRSDDLAARFGGDEFVVFLPNSNEDAAIHVAHRIQQKVSTIGLDEPIKGRPYLSVSFGIASFPQGHAYTDVFNKANEQLLIAKETQNTISLNDEFGHISIWEG